MGFASLGFLLKEESAAIWRERRLKMATTSARRRVPVTITWVVGKRKNGTCAAAHYLWFQKNVLLTSTECRDKAYMLLLVLLQLQ